MRPRVSRVLEQAIACLAGEVLPAVQPAFRQGLVGSELALLGMVREEFDRAAARRVEENAALRGLFARAAETVRDAALARSLAEAALGRDDDLRVPALDAANDALRALLIDLHSALEEQPDPEARALEEELWAELARSTERRRLSFAPF